MLCIYIYYISNFFQLIHVYFFEFYNSLVKILTQLRIVRKIENAIYVNDHSLILQSSSKIVVPFVENLDTKITSS